MEVYESKSKYPFDSVSSGNLGWPWKAGREASSFSGGYVVLFDQQQSK